MTEQELFDKLNLGIYSRCVVCNNIVDFFPQPIIYGKILHSINFYKKSISIYGYCKKHVRSSKPRNVKRRKKIVTNKKSGINFKCHNPHKQWGIVNNIFQ